MNVIVRSHHVRITEALKEYAKKKINKLEQFFGHIQQISVNLQINSSSASLDQQEASAMILCSGAVIKATQISEDMYSSIDLLYDKLAIQLKKYKEKIKKHKGNLPSNSYVEAPASNKKDVKTVSKGVERYIPKPMGAEDAAEILSSEKLNFLVFRNLKEKICVIYRSDNDEFGLIET